VPVSPFQTAHRQHGGEDTLVLTDEAAALECYWGNSD
jgi:hypothetical protein